MSILQEIRELESGKPELRKFSWVVGGVFLAIGAFAAYRGASWHPVPLWIGGPLFVVGSVAPLVVKPFYYAWMTLAVVMGFVMTRVILTIFFFVVLTPVGLVFRLMGKDLLHREIDREKPTYWIEKHYPIPDRSRYEKYF
jgi:hypothetical protein